MPDPRPRRARRALRPALAATAVLALGGIASAPAGAVTFDVTNTRDTGLGSLRQAILDANATPNVGPPDAIEFAILGPGPFVIRPATDLPAITDPVNLRGYTETGSVAATATTPATIEIWLDASRVSNGLVVQTDDSSISGLVIGSAGSGVASLPAGDGDGIKVIGDRNRVRGNHIGTHQPIASPPSFLQGTTGDGIDVTGDDNDVGSPVAEDRNVVAASGLLANQASFGVRIARDGNSVRGNTIGTDPGVTTSQIGNRGGVQVASGSRNQVGGSAVGGGNLISGNAGPAVDILGTATTVLGNTIGTDLTGLADFGNSQGIVVEAGATKNVIGLPAAGNLVVGTDTGPGIDLRGDANVVEHDVVGVDAGETTAISNLGGIGVTGRLNVIGGQTVDTGNVVGGNLFDGISLASADTTPGGDNIVWGNHVGTDESATRDLGNEGPGVLVVGGNANLIGGTGREGGKANVIADNDGAGVSVKGGTDEAILQNRVFGNGGLGIDLLGDGLVQANDAGDADTGPNGLQNSPTLTAVATAAGVTTVDWDISDFAATPKASTELDFYASATCDPSGSGEGETLVGSTVLAPGTAPGPGSTTLDAAVPAGQFVTAVATVGVGVPVLPGRSSEFSACIPA